MSELHQFEIDDDGSDPDKRWKRAVNRFLRALFLNPNLKIGTNNSEIIFPEAVAGKSKASPITASASGSFCELYQEEDDWFVSGGAVRVSDTDTFNVDPYAVSVATDYEKLLYIEVPVEVNRDDNGDYFMQGIVGSSATSLSIDDTATLTAYPAGTAPVLATGLGVVMLAVGRIKVVDGIPKFYPTGCGSFILEHCGGNVTHRPR